tara:strand:+ start:3454 stop:7110 length:3657 start_codon:yes stop_codon:yes gene_type:complete
MTENDEEEKNLPKIPYETVINDENVQNAVLKYHQQRSGDFTKIKEDPKEMVEEFIGDLRWETTNTVRAGTLAWWLYNSADEEAIDNFRFLYDTFEAMPKFYQEGGSGWGDGLWDYILATVIDPFTIASAWSGGTAKVAQTAATKASIRQLLKNKVKKDFGEEIGKGVLSSELRKNAGKVFSKDGLTLLAPAIKKGAIRGAIIDSAGATALDAATQSQLMSLGIRDEYSLGQTAAMGTLGGVIGAGTGGLSAGITRGQYAKASQEVVEGNYLNKLSRKPLTDEQKLKLTDKDVKGTDANSIRKEIEENTILYFDAARKRGEESLRYLSRQWGLQPIKKISTEGVEEGAEQSDLFVEEAATKYMDKILETRLNSDVFDRVTVAAIEMIEKTGATWDKKKNPQIGMQILEWLNDETIPKNVYDDVLKNLDIDIKMFSDIMFAEGSRAGTILQKLSAVTRMLDQGVTSKSPQQLGFEAELERLRKLNKETGLEGGIWSLFSNKNWMIANKARLGLMVSQLGTTIRNIGGVATGHVAVDALSRLFDNTLNLATRKRTMDARSYFDFLLPISNMMKDKKSTVYIAEMLQDSPALESRLLGNYSDFADKTGAGKGIGGIVDKAISGLNYFNRSQEFYFRKAFFITDIERQLSAQGKSLLKGIKEGKLYDKDLITDEMLEKATQRALTNTFAERPSYKTKFGQGLNQIIDFVKGSPLGWATPFPRFMFSSMSYFLHHNPTGLLMHTPMAYKIQKGLTKAKIIKEPSEFAVEKANQFSKGEYQDTMRAVIGTGFLGAAYMIRNNPELAGEKFYEINVPNTNIPDQENFLEGKKRVWDTRAWFPLVQYLYVADLIDRAVDGRSLTMKENFKEGFKTLTGANFRTGTGMAFIENAASMFSDDEGNVDVIQGFMQIASTIGPQYLTPIQQINDVLMQFGFQDSNVRDTRGTGFAASKESRLPNPRKTSMFVDQIASRLPLGVGDAVHEYLFREFNKYKISPLLPPGERVKRVDPILKQLFGTTITEKHVVAQVIDYWGVPYTTYMARTGDAGLDRRANLHMQYLLNSYMSSWLLNPNSEFNQVVELHRDGKASGEEVRQTLTERIKGLKSIASKAAREESPNLNKALSEYLRKSSDAIKAEDSKRKREEDTTGIVTPSVKEQAISEASRDQFLNPETTLRIEPDTNIIREEPLINPSSGVSIPGSEEEKLSKEEIKELTKNPLIRRRLQN